MNVSLTPVVNSKGHATSRHVQRGLIMNFFPTLHEISYETRKAVEIRTLCLFPIVTDSTLTHEAVSLIFSFSKSELLSKIAATLLTIISIYERFPGT